MADKFLELHDYHKAIEEEFGIELNPNNTPDEIRQKSREFAIKHLQSALQKIAYLVENADKDTTQLAAAKAVIQIAQGTSPKDEVDPLKRLLEEIAN